MRQQRVEGAEPLVAERVRHVPNAVVGYYRLPGAWQERGGCLEATLGRRREQGNPFLKLTGGGGRRAVRRR